MAATLFAAQAAVAGNGSEARIAVAANFRDAAVEIATAFEAETSYRVALSFGSTGQLFAQIAQGAPFDAFLAADRARAAKAVESGFAVAGTRFTYATGRIVLFSMDPDRVEGSGSLVGDRSARVAIAEPALAPYGAAAVDALRGMGSYETVKDRLVRGLSIAQAYQFVHSGNAELGFVALSQVASHDLGSRWIVPEGLHAPIAQDAVLLRHGEANPAARAFLAFLAGSSVSSTLDRFGYGRGR